jgi:hypothetical protein
MTKHAVRPGKLSKKLPEDFASLVRDPATKPEVLKAVLEQHDIEARGGYSERTALMMCYRNATLVRWLLDRGADIAAKDRYGNTALHTAARYGTREVMLLLLARGASPTQKTPSGNTPLHSAADERNLAGVKVLLARGVAVDAKNRQGLTPLEHSLGSCKNADLVEMVPVAQALLAAGAKKSRRTAELTKKLGETFEFYRADFNPDSVDETDAALKKLCRLFGVTPLPRRKMHDGQSTITVQSKTWQKQHNELWDLLVPGAGPAKTVQGEVIRITGRMGDEIHRNGGVNWDRDYVAMGKALLAHLASQNAADAATLADCRKILSRRPHDTETARLYQAAVAWVLANPMPKPLGKVSYRR